MMSRYLNLFLALISILVTRPTVHCENDKAHFPVLPFADGQQKYEGIPQSQRQTLPTAQLTTGQQLQSSSELLKQSSQEQKIDTIPANTNPINVNPDEDYDEEILESKQLADTQNKSNDSVLQQLLMESSSKADSAAATISPELMITITIEPQKEVPSSANPLPLNPIIDSSETKKESILGSGAVANQLPTQTLVTLPEKTPSIQASDASVAKPDEHLLVSVTTVDPEECENNQTEQALTISPIIVKSDHRTLSGQAVPSNTELTGKTQLVSNEDLKDLPPSDKIEGETSLTDLGSDAIHSDEEKTDILHSIEASKVTENSLAADSLAKSLGSDESVVKKSDTVQQLAASGIERDLLVKPEADLTGQVTVESTTLADSLLAAKEIVAAKTLSEEHVDKTVKTSDALSPGVSTSESHLDKHTVDSTGKLVVKNEGHDPIVSPQQIASSTPDITPEIAKPSDGLLSAHLNDKAADIVEDQKKPSDPILQEIKSPESVLPIAQPVDSTGAALSQPKPEDSLLSGEHPIDYDNIGEEPSVNSNLAVESKPSTSLLPGVTTDLDKGNQQALDKIEKPVEVSDAILPVEHKPVSEDKLAIEKVEKIVHVEKLIASTEKKIDLIESHDKIDKPKENITHVLSAIHTDAHEIEKRVEDLEEHTASEAVLSADKVSHSEISKQQSIDSTGSAKPSDLVVPIDKVESVIPPETKPIDELSEVSQVSVPSSQEPIANENPIEDLVSSPKLDTTASQVSVKKELDDEEGITKEELKGRIIQLANEFTKRQDFNEVISVFIKESNDLFKNYIDKGIDEIYAKQKGEKGCGDDKDDDDDHDDDDNDDAHNIHPVATVVINDTGNEADVHNQMKDALKHIKDNILPKSDSAKTEIIVIDEEDQIDPKKIDPNEAVVLSHDSDVGDHLAKAQDDLDKDVIHSRVVSDPDIKPIKIPQILNQVGSRPSVSRFNPNPSLNQPIITSYSLPSATRSKSRPTYVGSVPMGFTPTSHQHQSIGPIWSNAHNTPLTSVPTSMSMYPMYVSKPAKSQILLPQYPSQKIYPVPYSQASQWSPIRSSQIINPFVPTPNVYGSVIRRPNQVQYGQSAVLLSPQMTHSYGQPSFIANQWSPLSQTASLQPRYVNLNPRTGNLLIRNSGVALNPHVNIANQRSRPQFQSRGSPVSPQFIYSSRGDPNWRPNQARNSIYNPNLKTNSKQLVKQLMGSNINGPNAQMNKFNPIGQNQVVKQNPRPAMTSPGKLPIGSNYNQIGNSLRANPNSYPATNHLSQQSSVVSPSVPVNQAKAPLTSIPTSVNIGSSNAG